MSFHNGNWWDSGTRWWMLCIRELEFAISAASLSSPATYGKSMLFKYFQHSSVHPLVSPSSLAALGAYGPFHARYLARLEHVHDLLRQLVQVCSSSTTSARQASSFRWRIKETQTELMPVGLLFLNACVYKAFDGITPHMHIQRHRSSIPHSGTEHAPTDTARLLLRLHFHNR